MLSRTWSLQYPASLVDELAGLTRYSKTESSSGPRARFTNDCCRLAKVVLNQCSTSVCHWLVGNGPCRAFLTPALARSAWAPSVSTMSSTAAESYHIELKAQVKRASELESGGKRPRAVASTPTVSGLVRFVHRLDCSGKLGLHSCS